MRSSIREISIVVLLVILGLAVSSFLGLKLISSTSDQLIAKRSEQVSIVWANYIASQLPRIEDIVSGESLTVAERSFLEGAKLYGDIFRFELFDRNGQLRLVSDNLENLYGSSAADPLEGNDHVLRVVATGVPYTEVESGRDKEDRPDIYVETYVPVIRNGAIVGVVEVYIDVTEQAASSRENFVLFGLKVASVAAIGFCFPLMAIAYIYRALRLRNRQLASAEEAKSEFLAHVSHELRTPLNSIIGFSHAMIDGHLGEVKDEKHLEYMRGINTSGHHLLNLINDILDMSKIDAGEFELTEEEISLNDIVVFCIQMIVGRSDAQSLSINFVPTDDAPKIRADKRLINQVVLNILSNAVKYNVPNGSITISIKIEDRIGAEIAVKDTGIGISSDEITRVVEPFGQARQSPEVTHEGTGLGLALAKKMVELHSGSLILESQLGEGTTVTIKLPPERIVQP